MTVTVIYIVCVIGPPTSPTGLGYTAITNTSATLHWLPPTSADCVVHYDVEVTTTDDVPVTVDDTNTVTNVTQFNITGLTQGQEYQYRAAANNNIARGSYSTYSQPFTLDGKYRIQCITL